MILVIINVEELILVQGQALVPLDHLVLEVGVAPVVQVRAVVLAPVPLLKEISSFLVVVFVPLGFFAFLIFSVFRDSILKVVHLLVQGSKHVSNNTHNVAGSLI